MTKKNHTLSSETKMAQALRFLDEETLSLIHI